MNLLFAVVIGGTSLKSNFTAEYNETDPLHGGFKNLGSLPTQAEIDIFQGFEFLLNISLTCKYSIGLLDLSVDIYNFDITGVAF